jgi:hypothetical protein
VTKANDRIFGATPQLHSFARELVAAGTPAIVAMRESVDVHDANLFAELFYKDLFAQLQGLFALRANPAIPKPLLFPEVAWLRAIHEARCRLSHALDRQPDSSVEWTYPVVYVNRDELRFHLREPRLNVISPSTRLELVTQLDILRGARAALDPMVEPEASDKRADLDTQISQLERQLVA